MSANLLEVRDLAIEFDLHDSGIVRAVDGVSFRIPQSTTVALVGESGSGKSVCSQAIMRILPKPARITSGQILFNDPKTPGEAVDLAALPVNSSAMRAIRGGRISIIFQEPMTSLSPLHTVGDQVGEALKLHRKVSRTEANELTRDMLRLVGFPDPGRALKTYPFELSGGLRQRAMIAMALVCRPALLIADEPTTALDVTIQAQILSLMKELQDELGMAVLLITHDLGVVANCAQEVVVMYHGRVMEGGTLDDIFRDPQHPYLQSLLRAVPRFDMEPGERLVPLREIKSDAASLIGTGRQDPRQIEAGKPVLEVRDIRKTFRIRKSGWFGTGVEQPVHAVADVSFDIRRGECLGLVGESGCGKTTLSKILMRAVTPDTGSITFHDAQGAADVLALQGEALTDFRKRMQFVFQDPFGSLNPRMTVFDIISEPLIIHGFGNAEERGRRVRDLMTLVGLDVRHLSRYPHSFSGGQRQRIGIARALALQPDLLILDEPVSALDVSIQAQILNLLKDLQTSLGLTYLFISHNLAVVDYMADRIAVMCAGRLVEVAPREVLFRNPVHPYTQTLLAAVPDPSLDNPLDMRVLMENRASDPAAWPAPFTAGDENVWIELGNGHAVRARPDTNPQALVA